MSTEFEKTALEELKQMNHKLEEVNEKLDVELTKLRSEMRSELNAMRSEMLAEINSELDIIHSELDGVHSEIKDLKHSYDIMHESIVMIENTVTFEIPALLDGYKMSHDMQEIQHNRLNSLSFKVEDHDNRISILERKAK